MSRSNPAIRWIVGRANRLTALHGPAFLVLATIVWIPLAPVLGQAPARKIGRVTAVGRKDPALCEINLGSVDGVKVGDSLWMYAPNAVRYAATADRAHVDEELVVTNVAVHVAVARGSLPSVGSLVILSPVGRTTRVAVSESDVGAASPPPSPATLYGRSGGPPGLDVGSPDARPPGNNGATSYRLYRDIFGNSVKARLVGRPGNSALLRSVQGIERRIPLELFCEDDFRELVEAFPHLKAKEPTIAAKRSQLLAALEARNAAQAQAAERSADQMLFVLGLFGAGLAAAFDNVGDGSGPPGGAQHGRVEACVSCGGRGVILGDCPTCGGDGENWVPFGESKCGKCGGRGQRDIECRRCSGSGSVYVP